MKGSIRMALVAALGSVAFVGRAEAAGLGGSHASMVRQHEVALEHDYTFSRTGAQVRVLVDHGRLVPLPGNADYTMSKVSQPYARPEVRLFVERLAAQYRDATATKLVVTSLTRPLAAQPRNASPLSVHPAGMAVDLRIPADSANRAWLERKLLELEEAGVLDVTREHRPPHYHVAVFPDAYAAWAAAHPVERPAPAPVAAAPRVAVAAIVLDAGSSAAGRWLDALFGAGASALVGALAIAGAAVRARRRR